jgi:phenylalanyl-tRNA synthetase alpha chain
MQDVDAIVNEALALFAGIDDADHLEGAKARYLGKAGAITELRKTLGKLPPAPRSHPVEQARSAFEGRGA